VFYGRCIHIKDGITHITYYPNPEENNPVPITGILIPERNPSEEVYQTKKGNILSRWQISSTISNYVNEGDYVIARKTGDIRDGEHVLHPVINFKPSDEAFTSNGIQLVTSKKNNNNSDTMYYQGDVFAYLPVVLLERDSQNPSKEFGVGFMPVKPNDYESNEFCRIWIKGGKQYLGRYVTSARVGTVAKSGSIFAHSNSMR